MRPAASLCRKQKDSASKPDIYYIVPDGYPSDAWLNSTENYDNSDFTRALQERGFEVIGHAQSNYATTLVSLPSTLNMQYYESNPSPYSDRDYLLLEAANSKVASLLTDQGYTYIQLLSGSFIPSLMADIIRDFTPQGTIEITVDIPTISEALVGGAMPLVADPALIERSYKRSFFEAYVDTTLLRLARSRLGKLLPGPQNAPYHTSAPERFLDTIEEVVKISAMPEATFTIIHLLKPHAPVVFNERGEPIPWIRRAAPEVFFAELRFVNSRFLHLVDSILEQLEATANYYFSGGPRQPDGRGGPGQEIDLRCMTFMPHSICLRRSRSIFRKPYTTVNTFRLILNSVFDSGYELQTDKLIEQPKKYDAPFEQVDVTDEFLNDP